MSVELASPVQTANRPLLNPYQRAAFDAIHAFAANKTVDPTILEPVNDLAARYQDESDAIAAQPIGYNDYVHAYEPDVLLSATMPEPAPVEVALTTPVSDEVIAQPSFIPSQRKLSIFQRLRERLPREAISNAVLGIGITATAAGSYWAMKNGAPGLFETTNGAPVSEAVKDMTTVSAAAGLRSGEFFAGAAGMVGAATLAVMGPLSARGRQHYYPQHAASSKPEGLPATKPERRPIGEHVVKNLGRAAAVGISYASWKYAQHLHSEGGLFNDTAALLDLSATGFGWLTLGVRRGYNKHHPHRS